MNDTGSHDGQQRTDNSNETPVGEPRPTSSSSRSLSPISTFNPQHTVQPNVTPHKFATSTNAFNLIAVSPTSSSSSREGPAAQASLLNNERSPPQTGTSTTRRLRRPSMLSLAQPTGPGEVNMSRETSTGGGEEEEDMGNIGPGRSRMSEISPTDTRSNPFGFGQTPRGVNTGSLFTSTSSSSGFSRGSSSQLSAPSFGDLKTKTPPPNQLSAAMEMEDGGNGDSASPMEMEMGDEQRSPLRFLPSHLQTSASRRKGNSKINDLDLSSPTTGPPGSTPHSGVPDSPHPIPFNRKPLPASLVATLISENAPLEHEIQSEARLQRFIHSHPPRPPLTPRISKSTRGRFPEMADDDDDDDNGRRPSWRGRQWLGMRSDSDSDTDDDGEPVNSAFAAGMDLDRPMSMSSSSSSAVWPSGNVSESGKMTPGSGSISGTTGQTTMQGLPPAPSAGHPTPPPGNTTWGGAPRPARMSFGAAGATSSPGTGSQLPWAFGSLAMGGGGTPLGSPTVERSELGTSPGAVLASSPGLMQYRESLGGSASVRPGKRKAQPDDRYDPYKRPRGGSPSLTPMSPSQRPTSIPMPSSPFAASNSTRRAYAPRPLSSRSRQASPALSIGSTSGVLSTSLGNGNGKNMGGSYMPTGPAATLAAQQAQAPQQLGGLGLLSLANVGEDVEGEGAEDGGTSRSGSGSRQGNQADRDRSRDAMEED